MNSASSLTQLSVKIGVKLLKNFFKSVIQQSKMFNQKPRRLLAGFTIMVQ